MIIRRETQQAMINKYMANGNHTHDEVSGFVDGMVAAFEVVDKILKQEKNEKL